MTLEGKIKLLEARLSRLRNKGIQNIRLINKINRQIRKYKN